MKVFENTHDWIRFRRSMKAAGKTLGFVPTMGALHSGHISLVEAARESNDHTLVSIFVNPTQFNSKEDLEKYPRNVPRDIEALTAAGVDYVLLPPQKEIYPDNFQYRVSENNTSKILCGAYRPGHFEGVLTVVMKLLGLAQPERCYMGEKDYQQFLLVRDMAKAFFLETEIVPCPIVRENSGLAMSSRNERLSPAAREKAALIYSTVRSSSSCSEARTMLERSGFQVEYLEEHWGRRFVAAYIEGVRLIDNVTV